MGLNISKGNMYDFITHTWNTVKGACYHDCSYCYMKRWGKLNPVRFDKKEFKEFDRDIKNKYGDGQFIFVGSSCDMFAKDIPDEWIKKTLDHCDKYDNKYFFQTKNPQNIRKILPYNSSVCVTIESNLYYPNIMKNSPIPLLRFEESKYIRHPLYITIEPIMNFNDIFLEMLKELAPMQINIGADTGNNNLPEPPKEKIIELIKELEKFTKVKQKSNLKRLI